MVAIVGIDIGTQSLAAVVCDASLAVRGEGDVSYPIQHPRPGWAEQDPEAWAAALGPAIAAALAAADVRASDVVAIGVAGQLDGCVPVDAAGRACGPCLPWLDRRAVAELPAVDPARLRALTGQVADASHLAAKIRWLDRHRPGAARFHQPTSYLVERLCGVAVLDHALASTTMLYDLTARRWSAELLAAFAIDAARLPAIAGAASIAGRLTAAGAALTGLPVGIPVAVGTGDDFATPLGAGVVGPGTVACVIGTAEVVGALADHVVIDDGGLVESHAYPAGGCFVENPGWLSGGAVAWLGGVLGGAAGPTASVDAVTLDGLAAAVPPGAGGVTFLPALSGAMTPVWDPHARGAFAGLAAGHGAGHLARAVLEASALAMRDVVERLAALGVATDEILVLGGGAHSRLWAQIRADVTGRPVVIPAEPDTCALGAALLAAVAAGVAPSIASAAAALVGARTVIDPEPSRRAIYDDAHARYRALSAGLQGFHALRAAADADASD